jgi:predicted MFS family arabinose efflux permease
LLALWGLGSLTGGIAATRLGGAVSRPRGLTVLVAALALAHGALIFATGSVLALAILITLAGATIAPTVASIYAMVDAATPAGSETEAYSWLVTAELVGAALGAALGGSLAQHAGASAAFALVGVAGGLAALVALLRLRDRSGRQHVAEREPAPLDPLADLAGDRRVEYRTGVNERVELAVLAARVDVRR